MKLYKNPATLGRPVFARMDELSEKLRKDGRLISDLKNFIANLVLMQPELSSWISEEKKRNISSWKRGRRVKGCSEFLKKFIHFGEYRPPLFKYQIIKS